MAFDGCIDAESCSDVPRMKVRVFTIPFPQFANDQSFSFLPGHVRRT